MLDGIGSVSIWLDCLPEENPANSIHSWKVLQLIHIVRRGSHQRRTRRELPILESPWECEEKIFAGIPLLSSVLVKEIILRLAVDVHPLPASFHSRTNKSLPDRFTFDATFCCRQRINTFDRKQQSENFPDRAAFFDWRDSSNILIPGSFASSFALEASCLRLGSNKTLKFCFNQKIIRNSSTDWARESTYMHFCNRAHIKTFKNLQKCWICKSAPGCKETPAGKSKK